LTAEKREIIDFLVEILKRFTLKKKVIDYKYEFWSEVIASEIGNALGLDILHYDVAWNDDRLGCLSKSMIDPKKVELQEGYKWLTGFDAGYNINDKDAYTFQIIERLLTTRFKQECFIKDKNIIHIGR